MKEHVELALKLVSTLDAASPNAETRELYRTAVSSLMAEFPPELRVRQKPFTTLTETEISVPREAGTIASELIDGFKELADELESNGGAPRGAALTSDAISVAARGSFTEWDSKGFDSLTDEQKESWISVVRKIARVLGHKVP